MNKIIVGDCREIMRSLIAEGVKVQCVVTSPPYWGLRDYGTAKWEGGDPDCDHRLPTMRAGRNEDRAKLHGSQATNSPQLLLAARSGCGKCGAWRTDKQLGLEPTIESYVNNMVEVFGLVRELLADDGTLWLNLGDSYVSAPNGNHGKTSGLTSSGRYQEHAPRPHQSFRRDKEPVGETRHRGAIGLKEKDLCGVPWRVAFALQAAGWWLRQDIICHKPNPMPESIKDRCTKAHEYLFLLAKSERYLCDMEAIKEPSSEDTHARRANNGTPKPPAGWAVGDGPHTAVAHQTTKNHRKIAGGTDKTKNNASFDEAMARMPDFRNKRSVWTVASQPYSEAHFATFPPKLIEPCILAGSRPGDVVFDPFMGSGTTGAVAQRFGRQWLGIELNAEYAKLAEARTSGTIGMQLMPA